MTEEQRADAIRALLRERDGYIRRGLSDRVKAVDEELKRLGAEGRPPRERASKR